MKPIRSQFFLCLLVCILVVPCRLLVAAEVQGSVSELRLNELQYVGTHNSYHIAPGEAIAILMKAADFKASTQWDADALIIAHDYTHLSLTAQLRLGIRQFELDVFSDQNGGLFSEPGLLRMIQATPWNLPLNFNHHGDLDKPGFKVLHHPDFDFRSTNYLFTGCLHEIKAWSERNPGHFPIIIHVEPKAGKRNAVGDVYEPAEIEPFRRSTWLALEAEIRSVFSEEQIVTPDDVRGKHSNLRKAITTEGWPKLKELKGKVLFLLMTKKEMTNSYMQFGKKLEGRVFFTSLKPDHPSASWFRVPDPDYRGIPSFLGQGFLVSTMADQHTIHARTNDVSRRQAAFDVGAQFILTDYPVPDRRFSDYEVNFGDKGYVRPNPVTGQSN